MSFLDWLPADKNPTQAGYRDFARENPEAPSASNIGRLGGHRELLAEAAKRRRGPAKTL
jgi:hypothetical protein